MPVLDSSSFAFISHAGKNKPYARQLAAGLALYGVSVFFDEWAIHPGDSIPLRIEEAFERSTHFVLLWSKAAQESNWVERERLAFLHRAIATKKKIIPLLLDKTALPALIGDMLGVRARRVVDALDALVGPGRDEQAIRQMIVALSARMDELLVRGMPDGKMRCSHCGSNNLREGSGEDGGRAFDIRICGDCDEILDVCI